jgi:biopolymer transport protein ExbD
LLDRSQVTLASLAGKLGEIAETGKSRHILIKADRQASYGVVSDITELVISAGLEPAQIHQPQKDR